MLFLLAIIKSHSNYIKGDFLFLNLILSSFLYLNADVVNFYEADLANKMNIDLNQENNLVLEDNMRLDVLANTEYLGEYTRIISQKILEDDEEVYLLGGSTKLRDNLNRSSMDAIIIKYNKDKTIDKLVKLTGENYDCFNDGVILNNDLFVIGKTKSMHGDYQDYVNTVNYDTAILGKYDKDTLKLTKMTSLNHKLDTDFVKIKAYRGKLYVLCNNGKDKTFTLLIYDKNLVLYKEVTLALKNAIAYDLFIDDKIYLCGQALDDSAGIYRQSGFIVTLNFDLQTLQKKYYIGSDISAFYKIEKLEDKLFLFGALALHNISDFSPNVKGLVATYSNGNLKCKEAFSAIFLGGYTMGDDIVIYGGMVGKSKDYQETKYVPTYIYFNEELIPKSHYELTKRGSGVFISHSKNQKEVLLNYNNLYNYKKGSYLSANILSVKHIVLNEERLSYQEMSLEYQKASYLESFDASRYGKYYQYDLFENNYINVYKNFNELVVPLIKNTKSILYKKPLELTSNANMYCNGKYVKNGYEIKDEGVYKIEYYGINDLYTCDVLEMRFPKKNIDTVKDKDNNQNQEVEDETVIEFPKAKDTEGQISKKPSNDYSIEKEKDITSSIILNDEDPYNLQLLFENKTILTLVIVLIFALLVLLLNLFI